MERTAGVAAARGRALAEVKQVDRLLSNRTEFEPDDHSTWTRDAFVLAHGSHETDSLDILSAALQPNVRITVLAGRGRAPGAPAR